MPRDDLSGTRLETRLRRELAGEVLFDAFSRGRYSTDASIYQIEPLGIAVPKNKEDVAAALQIAREEGVPVLPRGAGTEAHFAEVPGNFGEEIAPERYRDLVRDMRALHCREQGEIEARFPKLLRRVGGYNIDMIESKSPGAGHNMAHLLVGSEGTLAFFTEIELDLQPIPPHRVLGICHFPSFYKAMQAAQHIAKLAPAPVDLVDRTMNERAPDN